MRKVSRTCRITKTATQRKNIMCRIFLLKENELMGRCYNNPYFSIPFWFLSNIWIYYFFQCFYEVEHKAQAEAFNLVLTWEKISLYNKNFHKTWECPSWHVFMKYRENSFSACYWATELTVKAERGDLKRGAINVWGT